MSKFFYVTTACDYANGLPHLGHAYEKILADTIARYKRLRGQKVHFMTGLDEHGQKVQQSAKKKGLTPQALCDEMAHHFQRLCKEVQVQYDDYVRTTEPRHKAVVSQILEKLYKEGAIYKGSYSGFYSTKEEQFLQEKDKVDGKWPERFGEVTEVTETNYFFKLSQYRDWLAEYIQEHPDFIFPAFRAKQVLEFLKEPINDLCISRPVERLSWGIPLPFDKNYVTYVWFDALIYYLSASQYGSAAFSEYWPADVHVIGKDILVPAHAVYWTIMLKALNLPQPKTFVVHGWWTKAGTKMSKSQGNVIDPFELLTQGGADAFRYFLMREMHVGHDSEFTLELFLARYNSDLANDLGNLLSRLFNMTARYCDNKVPTVAIVEPPEEELKNQWKEVQSQLFPLFDSFQFHVGLEKVFKFISGLNRYAEMRAPWKLAKSADPADRKKLETTLGMMAEGLRLASLALAPVMPQMADKVQNLLEEPAIESWEKGFEWSSKLTGRTLGESCILFPKLEFEQPPAE